MNEQPITASPLTWPEGWKRHDEKIESRFNTKVSGRISKITIGKAVSFTIKQLELMKINSWNIIISTDLKLRNDGLPYSTQRIPEDVGASVWWKGDDEVRHVMALDKYDRVADNIYAIGKTIEALRGIERWGSGEILDRTFNGFKPLPGPETINVRNWREILDYYGDDLKEAKQAYKILRMDAHPDRGGSEDQWNALTNAWLQCQQELN